MANNFRFNKKLLKFIRAANNDEAQSIISPDLALAFDGWGSLLHHSVALDNSVIAKCLLDLGSPVDAVTFDDKTPLALAVQRRHPSVVQVLLDAGASIDAAAFDGKSALELAFDSRYIQPNVLQCLVKRLRSDTPDFEELMNRLVTAGCNLHRAVMSRDTDVVKSLLDRPKVKINSKSYGGSTALLFAAIDNNDEMVKTLIAGGADVNITDSNGNNALSSAAVYSNSEMVRVLLEKRADPKRENVAGHTCLSILLSSPSIDDEYQTLRCAELLLQGGAFPETSKFNVMAHLNFVATPRKQALADVLVAHLTMLEMLKETDIDPSNDELVRCLMYHQMCKDLLEMNCLKNVTLANLLLNQPEYKIRICARNKFFISIIEDFCSEHKLNVSCVYYYNVLMKRIPEIVRSVKLEEEAVSVMGEIFNCDFNQCYVISRKIFAYLDQSDLENLCRVTLGKDL